MLSFEIGNSYSFQEFRFANNNRKTFKDLTQEIVYNSDEVIYVEDWRGQPDGVFAYIQGEDVVLVDPENEYITTLKGGTSNERIKNKRK